MKNRFVEITTDNVHLSLSRGFLKISKEGERLGQICIEDMSALIVRGYGTSISLNLCSRLAQNKIPTILCGSNQSPASIVWPIEGHFAQGHRMQAQAAAGKPLKKRLWQELVKAKINAQAAVLESQNIDASALYQMAKRVKSGDKENIEAQASRRYWPLLMGETFRRCKTDNRELTDTIDANAFLNYGYTILRSAAARSILAAGLHPSFSLHHESAGDAFRLADDLMEPFRPFVDLLALECRRTKDL